MPHHVIYEIKPLRSELSLQHDILSPVTWTISQLCTEPRLFAPLSSFCRGISIHLLHVLENQTQHNSRQTCPRKPTKLLSVVKFEPGLSGTTSCIYSHDTTTSWFGSDRSECETILMYKTGWETSAHIKIAMQLMQVFSACVTARMWFWRAQKGLNENWMNKSTD